MNRTQPCGGESAPMYDDGGLPPEFAFNPGDKVRMATAPEAGVFVVISNIVEIGRGGKQYMVRLGYVGRMMETGHLSEETLIVACSSVELAEPKSPMIPAGALDRNTTIRTFERCVSKLKDLNEFARAIDPDEPKAPDHKPDLKPSVPSANGKPHAGNGKPKAKK